MSESSIRMFLPGQPPRATSQQKGVTVRHGQPMFYRKAKIQAVHDELAWKMRQHVPPKPIDGPVRLDVCWLFRTKTKKQNNALKVTRPDLDNLQKSLKDVMTDLGFWNDDSQVAIENTEKRWSLEPGIHIEVTVIEECSE